MTVYIDDAFRPYRGMRMCHMIADTDAELQAMADRLGLRRSWQHDDHYDVGSAKRGQAIKAGAVAITERQAAMMRARRRATGELGRPDDARRWFDARFAGRAA